MIEQLKVILKEAIIQEGNIGQHNQFLQYKTSNDEILSLSKEALTDEQIKLLNLFLTPLQKEAMNETPAEYFWKMLTSTGDLIEPSPFSPSTYRFIHFYINGALQDETEFAQALQGLFQREVTLVWNKVNEGFIVEYIANEDDEHEVDSLVEAIMTDFYVKVSIFQGSTFTNFLDAKKIFDWEKTAFSLGRKALPKLAVIRKEQLIPFLLTHEASEITKKMLLQTIGLLQEDKELLKTIKVFFESNLNTTLAAKTLFMHRNSLQYRIDKFIEKTGIDIKQFQQAAATYMLIALNDTREK